MSSYYYIYPPPENMHRVTLAVALEVWLMVALDATLDVSPVIALPVGVEI